MHLLWYVVEIYIIFIHKHFIFVESKGSGLDVVTYRKGCKLKKGLEIINVIERLHNCEHIFDLKIFLDEYQKHGCC